MLSDGDSTSFAAIVDLQPYGPDVSIAKLECINHAGKRLRTALRSLAKREHLGGCGTGKLTNQKIMTLQRYYRAAIKTSGDNVEVIQHWYGQRCSTVLQQMNLLIIDIARME